jgi:phosphoribosylamine--glycine ligase
VKLLVVGSGGREHALAWKLAQSPRVDEVLVAPGNGGTARCARNVPLPESDVGALVALARREKVDFTVIGPELPIACGAADAFEEAALPVFAPSRRCARLESSKVWAKAFLSRQGIPTAPFHVSSRFDDAVALVRMMPSPVVIKASGLAAGKGVTIASSVREAEDVLRRMMVDRAFDSAGDEVVLESCLEGREVSLLAFVDEHTALPMPMACDYKRLEDGDRGPNTGGVGAYSPPSWLDESTRELIMKRVFWPTIEALRREGLKYRGVLYIGLMITAEGPWVLEFNVRFGDPETQVILPALESDLLDLLQATSEGRLGEVTPRWSDDTFCAVVLTSRGYPGLFQKGVPFPDLEGPDALVFHAGTAIGPDGGLVTQGGRIASVVGRGPDLAGARARAYEVLGRHDLSLFHHRRDIGTPSPAMTGKRA